MGSLTDSELKGLKVEQSARPIYIADGGGLYVRVFSSGVKEWVYRYKVGAKTIYHRFAVYSRTTTELATTVPDDALPHLSLADARQQALEFLKLRKAGIDPRANAQGVIEDKRSERAAAEAEAQKLAQRMTVSGLFDLWFELRLTGKGGRKDGGAEVKRAFERDVLPVIGTLAIEDVQPLDITQVIEAIERRGAKRLAGRTLAEIKQLFRFAVNTGRLVVSPAGALAVQGGRGAPRDVVLADQDIQRLARQLSGQTGNRLEDAVPFTLARGIWILLGTAMRVGELSKAQWKDVDFRKKEWTLPDTKNGTKHLVHLSDFVISELLKLKALTGATPYLFPSRTGAKCPHLNEKAIAKAVKDRQRSGGQALSKRRATHQDALVLSCGAWTPHDLRRTAATLMGELKVLPAVIEKCLNHKEPDRVKATYQRYEYLAERRDAFQKLGEHLSKLCEGEEQAQVVPIKKSLNSGSDAHSIRCQSS
jgi:integrase